MAGPREDVLIALRMELINAKETLKQAKRAIKGVKTISQKAAKGIAKAEQAVADTSKKLSKVGCTASRSS